MNDFTKEELRCLLLTLDNVYLASRTVRQDELQEKIQSMIDNYHKFKVPADMESSTLAWRYQQDE